MRPLSPLLISLRRSVHLNHLKFAGPISPASATPPARESGLLIPFRAGDPVTGTNLPFATTAGIRRGSAPAERHGPQFAVPTPPRRQRDGHGACAAHRQPPRRMSRDLARVEGGDDEVEGVHGEGEVGDEFGAADEEGYGEGHEEAPVENPDEAEEPALRRVAAHGGPAEDEVNAEVGAGDERGEEHEGEGDGVVERLQGGDLTDDLEGWEFGQGAGARGAAPARHGGGCVVWGACAGAIAGSSQDGSLLRVREEEGENERAGSGDGGSQFSVQS